jgi:hypothetical protein
MRRSLSPLSRCRCVPLRFGHMAITVPAATQPDRSGLSDCLASSCLRWARSIMRRQRGCGRRYIIIYAHISAVGVDISAPGGLRSRPAILQSRGSQTGSAPERSTAPRDSLMTATRETSTDPVRQQELESE